MAFLFPEFDQGRIAKTILWDDWRYQVVSILFYEKFIADIVSK